MSQINLILQQHLIRDTGIDLFDQLLQFINIKDLFVVTCVQLFDSIRMRGQEGKYIGSEACGMRHIELFQSYVIGDKGIEILIRQCWTQS